MRGLNRTMLIGHLGRDPETRTGKSGLPWTSFSLATGRSTKEGDRWVETTDWHRVKVFGGQAELCDRFLRKGSMVAVEGSIVYDTWEKDGVRRTTTAIHADRVTFLGKGRSQGVSAQDVAQEVAQAK